MKSTLLRSVCFLFYGILGPRYSPKMGEFEVYSSFLKNCLYELALNSNASPGQYRLPELVENFPTICKFLENCP